MALINKHKSFFFYSVAMQSCSRLNVVCAFRSLLLLLFIYFFSLLFPCHVFRIERAKIGRLIEQNMERLLRGGWRELLQIKIHHLFDCFFCLLFISFFPLQKKKKLFDLHQTISSFQLQKLWVLIILLALPLLVRIRSKMWERNSFGKIPKIEVGKNGRKRKWTSNWDSNDFNFLKEALKSGKGYFWKVVK